MPLFADNLLLTGIQSSTFNECDNDKTVTSNVLMLAVICVII